MLKKATNYLKAFLFYPKSLLLRFELSRIKYFLNSEYKWFFFKSLEIPGFGEKLLRVDFPPPKNPRPRYGYGWPFHREIKNLLDAKALTQQALLEQCIKRASDYKKWPQTEPTNKQSLPWLQNPFLPKLDMVVLLGLINYIKPIRYIEVGSGISTRVVYQAKKKNLAKLEIISIDPEPRVEIKTFCSKVITKRLEDSNLNEIIKMSGEKTIFSFDGSHRCFPSSDVTVFFLEILPRLKKGTVVHIHDIYLPSDYSRNASERLWSEQYLLASYLLGGAKKIKILLPVYYLSVKKQSRNYICKRLGTSFQEGFSFWLKIV